MLKEQVCVVSSKRVFSGCTSGAICCDNGSRFITGVSITGYVQNKSGRNYDFGFSTCFLFFCIGIYIYIILNSINIFLLLN